MATSQLLTAGNFAGGSTDIYGLMNLLADRDSFTFYAKAGETVTLDIDGGSVIGIDLDSVLYLYDSSETLLAINDDYIPVDPGSDSDLDSFKYV